MSRYLFSLVLATTLFAGCKESPREKKESLNFSQPILTKTLEKVRQEYVDIPDEGKMIEGALNGMLMALDPYCSFFAPESFQIYTETENGEFGGLGMEITRVEGGLKVIAPLDDMPAQKAGIKTGDIITEVNNVSITSTSLEDVLKKLHGKPGTAVKLTVHRGSKPPMTLKVTRDQILVNPVKHRTLGDIAYVRISTFNDQTTDKLLNTIQTLQQSLKGNLHGLILDLRNNPGGKTDQAVSVANLFLTTGKIIEIKSRNPARNRVYKAKGRDLIKGIPISVLVNEGSASASEIVAAALKDNHRAVLVGKKTYGKGLIQDHFPIENYGTIKLSISRFYTPKGQAIQNNGISPDITVSEGDVGPDNSNSPPQTDAQLDRAVDLLHALWALKV